MPCLEPSIGSDRVHLVVGQGLLDSRNLSGYDALLANSTFEVGQVL